VGRTTKKGLSGKWVSGEREHKILSPGPDPSQANKEKKGFGSSQKGKVQESNLKVKGISL